MKIAVGLRTHAGTFNCWNSVRFMDVNKPTLVTTCFNSLLHTIKNSKHEIKLSIHDDNSPAGFTNELLKLSDSMNIKAELFETDAHQNFKSQYEWMKEQDCDYCYCIEDDYLHRENCIDDMVDAIYYMKELIDSEFAVFPFNCPHRYLPETFYLSYIFNIKNKFWRSLLQSSHTFFISKIAFDHYDDIMRYQSVTWPSHEAVEIKTINKIWEEGNVKLICPLESLAYHMADESQKDYTSNWQELWEKYYVEYK